MQPVPNGGKATETPPAAPPAPPAPNAGKPAEGTKLEGAKPEGDKPGEKPGEKPKTGAPEKYAFETPKGLPEGHKLDEAVIADYSTVARELGLTQEQGQKLLDKVLPTIHRRGMEAVQAEHAKWVEAIKSHPELGGAKLAESQKTAQRAIDFFDKKGALTELLTGPLRLGDNPAFFEVMHAIGSAMKGDGFVDGKPPSSGGGDDATTAKKLYPKSS